MNTVAWRLSLALLVLASAVVRADEAADLHAQLVAGPTDITLKDEAVLHLPAGYYYLPKAPATQLMERLGNQVDERFLGLVLPQTKGSEWIVDLEYEDAGYVKDDDAQHWNADELLKSLKDGTEASNEQRRSHNVPELEVVGWAQPPKYDGSSHQLLWSALAREKGAAADKPQTVNYNTYALGREGYVSLNLITDSAHIDDEKHIAQSLLDDLKFNSGKRYEDFNSSTDHVAAYGLAALVAGVAAKKIGLLAMGGLFFAKFFKLIAVAAVGGHGGPEARHGRQT
jgi:uncharacterized membrane-anchored protein